jgi:hypothetical protein
LTFSEVKDVAALMSGDVNQIVTISVLAIAGAFTFAAKHWPDFSRASKVVIGGAVSLMFASMFLAFLTKGWLVKLLLDAANQSEKNPAALLVIADYVSKQTFALILGTVLYAVAIALSRSSVYPPETDA